MLQVNSELDMTKRVSFKPLVMMCEYSKFQIEWNSYFSIRFETSTIFKIFEYLPSPISYLFKQNDADPRLATNKISKHFGLPSTVTSTTETTIVLNSAAP